MPVFVGYVRRIAAEPTFAVAHVLQIAACGKRFAGAGQDHAADAGVSRDAGEGIVERVKDLGIGGRVARLRLVQCQRDDRAVALEHNGVAHAATSRAY